MSRVEAEREVEALEQHAAFCLRMGCPPDIADAPLRERLVEALAEVHRLRDAVEDARYDERLARSEADDWQEEADRWELKYEELAAQRAGAK